MPLILLFFSVANAFDAALKAYVFTFGGIFAAQKRCQRTSFPSGLVLVAANSHWSGELLKAK
jgi:hypothetical protein